MRTDMDISSVSTKGQVVIPLAMREQLGLKSGSKLAVFCDGSRLLMKPISKPQVTAFADLIAHSDKVMAGVTKTKKERTK